ncbi:MAG: helix-turn-helix transcriptional regulator [Mycobacterium sp.]|nr:helix-turn-helix transcriptional regulator [Mycobacterium sp.]
MNDLERFGRVVRARREELGIQQEEMSSYGGPSSTTMSRIERGVAPPSPKSLRKLDTGLRWQPGSAKRTLTGGDPTPLSTEIPALPNLPRNAPNMPVLGAVDMALGIHPTATTGRREMPAADRKLLLSARNKLVQIGNTDAGFTEEETRALARFIEDNELRTLHVRIDWLPRAEQLQVSALVDELTSALEHRWVADGYNNESEHLPEYAQPNPLPVEGIAPDPADFPSQPISMKEQGNVVEATPQSDASGEAREGQEAGSPHDAKSRPDTLSRWGRGGKVEDGNESA